MTMMQGLSLTGVPVSAVAKKRGELWLQDCLSHVSAMHKVLACLYSGLVTDADFDADFEEDDRPMEEDSARLSMLFSDHCHKLVKRMTDPTDGPVEFPLSQIMTVLGRCLSLSFADVLQVPSRTDLLSVLPSLHQSSMDVLSQLIVCCGRDILHHSRSVIDMCLQTIVSTAKMSIDNKYRTRSSVYQALVLWVRTCGWGKYLSSHKKLLLQEVIADTQADAEDTLSKKDESDESKSKQGSVNGKGRKGKKKKGQRGDSYMELGTKDDDRRKEQNNPDREDLVMWAFSWSELAVENLPFSSSQTLISHLIKTASTVQRLSPQMPPPYHQTVARKALYQAVAGCLLSSLEARGNRNDAVSHYQMTNSALDILVRACHGDHSQIQTVCSQALATLKSSSCVKGPVIRKVLDYEDSGMEDVSQLMRDNEHQSDCIEDLRQKLMNSEMENEQQSRLISSLREQITILQSKASVVSEQQTAAIIEGPRSDGDKVDYKGDTEDDDDDDNDDDEMIVDNAEKSHSFKTEDVENKPANSTESSAGVHKKDKDASLEKAHRESTEVTECLEERKDIEKETMTVTKKRANDADMTTTKDMKRPKVSNMVQVNDKIEDMLQDFVDAPPDS